MIDRRPALIVPCRGVADVVASVRFARAHQLPLAVRGGGHNVAGFGTCDGGLVIDLSPMRGVRVDPATRTAQAGGGATWGDLDRETQLFGLAAPGGVVSTHRDRRADARGWAGLASAHLRHGLRQPRFGRRRDRRRRVPDRQSRPTTPTCSGRCAAGAATSGSSPPSNTVSTPSDRWSPSPGPSTRSRAQ